MTTEQARSQGDSEVFRFGGFGAVLLILLLANRLEGDYPCQTNR